MGINLEQKSANIEKKLQSFWKDWNIVRHIGTGAYSEVYEIHRDYFGIDNHSALKIVQLDSEGYPVRCRTETWDNAFYSPKDEPTASFMMLSSDSPSGRDGSLPSESNSHYEYSSFKPGVASRTSSSSNPESSGSSGRSGEASHSRSSIQSGISEPSHPAGFLDEINIMSQLRGAPNVVSIDDYYVQTTDSGTIIYIRMELLTCLSNVLKFNTGDTFSDSEVQKLGMDICRALSYCEKINVIHRDIKPGNMFINRFGDYLIGDFGISRPLNSFSAPDSTLGTGTISYMAPEIYSHLDYGRTTDIYSLGIVLYQILNRGRVPFLPIAPISYTKEDLNNANARRFRGEPLPPISFADKGLQAIIRKACAFLPEDRYASAQEFFTALSEYKFPEKSSAPVSLDNWEEATTNIRETSPRRKSSSLFFDDFPDDDSEWDSGSSSLSQKKEDLSRDFSSQKDEKLSRKLPSQKDEKLSRKLPSREDETPSRELPSREGETPSRELPSREDLNSSSPSKIKSANTSSAFTAPESSASAVKQPQEKSPAGKERQKRNEEKTEQKESGGTSGKASGMKKAAAIGLLAVCACLLIFVSLKKAPWKPAKKTALAMAEPSLTISGAAAEPSLPAIARLVQKEEKEIENTPLDIADTSLKHSIIRALGISGDNILLRDTYGVTELTLELADEDKEKGIKSLEGLSLFPSLQSVSLEDCGLGDDVDFSALETLPDLQILSLHDNAISSTEPFRNLSGMQWLDLSDNKIKDLSPMANMTGLQSLSLYNNEITDISALSKMTGLVNLYLDDNKITSLSPLREMKNLKVLGLDDNEISDLAPLQGLTGLRSLILSDNKITDASSLKSLTNLRELWIGENQIADAGPLSSLRQLTWLSIEDNKIKDLTPLQNLTSLGGITLSENSIEDIAPLQKLTKLAYLDLEDNKIKALSPLEKLSSLETLYLNDNEIEDLSPLKALKNLKILALGKNKIKDLSSLKDLTALQSLDLYTNEIEDISGLSKMKKLTWLNIGRNKISDLSPVSGLTKLVSLQIYRNSIGDLSAVEKLASLKYLVADVNSITSLQPLQKLNKLESLYVEYNNIQDVSPLKDLKQLKEVYLAGNPVSDYSPLDNLSDSTKIYRESR